MSYQPRHAFARLSRRARALTAAAAIAVIAAGTGVLASGAAADSPHFVSASAAPSGTGLVFSFREAGLGDNQLVTDTASAFATAQYDCVNGGGNHPSAQNKATVSSEVSKSGTFTSGKNGNVTGTLAVAAPGPGSFSCPPGQKLELAQVSYSDLTLTDNTNNVTRTFPGTFTTGCLLAEVRNAC